MIGAVSTIIALCGIILDIVTGAMTGGNIASLPSDVTTWFALLHSNPLLGLYRLDLLNSINQILLIPSIFALFIAQKERNGNALLALILFLVGSSILISGNTALTMLDLSSKYDSTSSEEQRNLILAAGEAMLSKGKHGSLSVFIGFTLPTMATMWMSIVMLREHVFSRLTSFAGIAGSLGVLFHVFLVTFSRIHDDLALIIAIPAGLLIMLWMILYMITFLRLAQSDS